MRYRAEKERLKGRGVLETVLLSESSKLQHQVIPTRVQVVVRIAWVVQV